ncbi:MAG: hypothetical protein K9M56_07385 [Victivallales bacterium]|nr:hypothetical protein [Victivallales bacterium]
MQIINNKKWAYAISERLSDEWHFKSDFPEDAELLKSVLYDLLLSSPENCKKLIGTGIIEEDYFKKI